MSQERSADGRRRRGEDNRARIVAAMLALGLGITHLVRRLVVAPINDIKP